MSEPVSRSYVRRFWPDLPQPTWDFWNGWYTATVTSQGLEYRAAGRRVEECWVQLLSGQALSKAVSAAATPIGN